MRQPTNLQNPNLSLEKPLVEDFLKTLAVCAALFLLVLVVYGQTARHEFVYCDDNIYIYENSRVNQGLTWENVKWSLTNPFAGNWHPLTWISHMIDWELYGKDNPGGHHITSLLLHAASVVVLFLAMQRLSGAFWCSAFVAAMFAIHPLRAESVAWTAERKDVLSGLFWMLTMLTYANYVRRPGVWRYLLILLMYGLGLSAKSMLVTLPCVLLLLDIWPLRRWQSDWFKPTSLDEEPSSLKQQTLGFLLLEKVPLFAMSAALCVAMVIIQRNMGAMNMTTVVPMDVRIANAVVATIAYLWTTIWPFNLTFFYPHANALGDAAVARLVIQAIVAGVLLVVITSVVLRNLRRRVYLAVGWFWYLGTLVPVIGLVQVGAQARADRYTYLPMIGVSIMLAWGFAELTARWSQLKKPVAVAASLLLLAWTILCTQQVSYWKNSETLFKQAIAATEDNFFAHNHLGLIYQQQSYSASGERQKELRKMAKDEFMTAVDIAPSYDAANSNLGGCYLADRDFERAIQCFKDAVNVNTFNAGHRINLGIAYFACSRVDDAIEAFRGAVEADRNRADTYLRLGDALRFRGDNAEAVAAWKKALEVAPGLNQVKARIAIVLASCPDASVRNGPEALELALDIQKQARPIEKPEFLEVLAEAYAENGQFTQAVEAADEAMKIAARQNRQDLVQYIRIRKEKFEDGKPWREIPRPQPKAQPTPKKEAEKKSSNDAKNKP